MPSRGLRAKGDWRSWHRSPIRFLISGARSLLAPPHSPKTSVGTSSSLAYNPRSETHFSSAFIPARMAGREPLNRYVSFADTMAGQGSPLPPLRTCWIAVLAWLGLCLLSAGAIAQERGQVLVQDSGLRLRLAWGGGESRAWQGTIRLSEGRILEFAPLGLEADTPGSMWLTEQGD